MSKDIFDPSWMNPGGNGGIDDPPGGVDPAMENNPDPKKNLRLKALAWITDNPRGYAYFMMLARQFIEKNQRFGINWLMYIVRYDSNIRLIPDARGFRLNNNHAPYIARKLLMDEPKLEGLIRCRDTRW